VAERLRAGPVGNEGVITCTLAWALQGCLGSHAGSAKARSCCSNQNEGTLKVTLGERVDMKVKLGGAARHP